VLVQPWFLLVVALIGPRDLAGLALWLGAATLGVLAHELGHAVAARRFGLAPEIELHGFGGTTRWTSSVELPPGRRILITAAGPAVGLTLGAASLLAAWLLSGSAPMVGRALWYLVWVNLVWGVLNLLPVLPLDGGQIVSTALQARWGPGGRRAAAFVSLVVCAGLAVAALVAGWLWSAIIAAVLAVGNIQSLRGLPSPDGGVASGGREP
jgi:Zn-dependent protease